MEQTAGKPRRLKTALLCGTLAAVLAVPSMLAYLTDTDSATNKFTLSEQLQIELSEGTWDPTDDNGNGVPDAAENVAPGQSIDKSPMIWNRQGPDAYMFMEVKVPVAEVQTAGDAAPVVQELFTYDVSEADWVEIESEKVSAAEATDGYAVHVYKYVGEEGNSGGGFGTVGEGRRTNPLFTEVTLVNYINDQSVNGSAQEIVVNGFGIQTEGFDSADDAWAAYKAQNGL